MRRTFLQVRALPLIIVPIVSCLRARRHAPMLFVPRGSNRGDQVMAGPRRWLAGTAMVLLAAWMAGAADSPKPPLVGPPEPPPRMPRADGEGLVGPDGLQLPPDAKAVVLPRDKYQDLMDELARLREQVKPGKPPAPSFCDIVGQIDGDLARLHVNFRF